MFSTGPLAPSLPTVTDWPNWYNRPAFNLQTRNLTWIGPLGGGPNNGNPVQQSRTLTLFGGGTSDYHTSVNGEVISGLQIGSPGNPQRVYVDNNTVTVKQCAIFGDFFGVEVGTIGSGPNDVGGSVVEDCWIKGELGVAGCNGVAGNGSTAGGGIIRRNNIFNVDNGIFQFEDLQQFTDNWIHDLSVFPTSHSDGIQGGGGTSLLIYHNTVFGIDNSSIFMQDTGTPYTGLHVINNLLICENIGGSTVCQMQGSAGGAIWMNNLIGETGVGGYSSFVSNTGSIVWQGNVDAFTGVPIPTF
jgi:hypothetical protein